jgi:hypothetical protein
MADVTRQRLGGGDDPWGRLVPSLHSHTDGCKSGVIVEYGRPKLRWFAECFLAGGRLALMNARPLLSECLRYAKGWKLIGWKQEAPCLSSRRGAGRASVARL